MILIVHDAKGEITQVFLQVTAFTFEGMSAKYAEMGILHVLHDADSIDMANNYVVGGKVIPKPELKITGNYRPIKADGLDTLSFQIDPTNFDVALMFDGKIVHQGTVSDGDVSFSADHAGIYAVHVVPPFPWRGAVINIEVQP